MTESAPAAGPPNLGARAGIFVLSLAILVLQIGLTRLLSVVLWYHFAFVAISLAMLGLGLAGVGLYLWPRLLAATPKVLPWYCRGAGVTAVLALAFAMTTTPTASGGSLLALDVVGLYLVLLVPFTLAGFAVSALLATHARHIGRLYAWDLAGAGLGCILAVPLLDLGGAPTAILSGAFLLLLGARCVAGGGGRWLDLALVLGLLGVFGWHTATGAFEPKAMHGVPDEDPANGITREFAGWNSHSRIVVTRNSDVSMTINIDGSATTGIYRIDGVATREAVRQQMGWLGLRAGSMPYVLLGDAPAGDRSRVLLIGPGGGLDLLNGIYYGADITGVELNGLIHGLMSDSAIGRWAGDVYRAPGVRVVHDEARSWVRRTDERFDLIQASMIDTWAATAGGAFALAENSLYTVEAFADYRAHLTERGLVHFMRWHESPPRQSLRLLALVAEVMQRDGDTAPDQHVVVLEEPQYPVQGTPMASVLWSNRPFTGDALQRLRDSIADRQKHGPVRVLCWPGEAHDNDLSRFLRSSDRAAFLRDHEFDVRPTTDDRPFFFHTVRLGRLLASPERGFENEEAVRVLSVVLVTVLAITLLAFVLPLLLTVRGLAAGGGGPVAARLSYFCCLGVGFMLVEIPMLQRFGLYLGHPTWSLSTVLGALLLGAGHGGMRTASVTPERLGAALRRALWSILIGLTVAAACTPAVLAATLRWPLPLRALLTVAVLMPLGVLLGQALPLGVRVLEARAVRLVPWAWGMNGAASVLASVLAVAMGMQFGFTAALLTGIGCYGAGLLLARRL